MALSSLARFISPDLAQDLSGDIMTMLTSTKPYLRKKAVLIMYKVFLRYPEALRPAFPRLREKLEDPDPGVQSAAVNVICELARKNPKNYLSLAPTFFKLMTTSTNNWMLIKIIKLFGALTPLEPRLGKKLIEPLTNLIHSTSAMSLLYECINTVIAVLISISSGMPNHTAAIQLCVQKLRILIEDSDQNLKYLGLLAMSKILKTHPKSVQGHKDLVMHCLDDSDESIRLRALDLLYGMVSKKNLMEIVKKLMVHMDKAEGTAYRDELMEKIINICSQNDYQYVTNFEWYVSVLVELTRMEGGGRGRHGALIAAQMMDVAIRVETIRGFAVAQMALLIENSHLLMGGGGVGGRGSGATEVLYAACWICGEFAGRLPDARETLKSMFRGKVSALPGHIQAVYIQNGLKLFVHVLRSLIEGGTADEGEILGLAKMLQDKIGAFANSADLEVQERACSALQVVAFIIEAQESGDGLVAPELAVLYQGDLNPVGPKAQKKVPVPEGLDLDAWINEPPAESEDEPSEEDEEEDEDDVDVFVSVKESSSKKSKKKKKKSAKELNPEQAKEMKEARLLEQSMNPNYLKDSPRSPARSNQDSSTPTGEEIPAVQAVDLGVPLHIPGLASADQYLNISRDSSVMGEKAKKKKKKSKKSKKNTITASSEEDDEEEPAAAAVVVSKNMEMPEGAVSDSDEDRDALPEDDPHRALADVRLDDLEYQAPYKSKESEVRNMRFGDDGAVPEGGLFGSAEKKKKKKKEVEPEDAGAEKKKKKKKKHKKEEDLLNGDEEDDDEKEKKKKSKKSKKDKKEKKKDKKEEKAEVVPEADDMDFWLSSDVQAK